MRRIAVAAATVLVLASATPAYASPAPTTLEITCPQGASAVNSYVEVAARLLDATGAQIAHEPIDLTRQDAYDPPADLGKQATDATAWTFWNGSPPNRGTVTWTVTYAGDNNHAGATGNCTTEVEGAASTLAQDDSPPTVEDQPLIVTGHLTAPDGTALADRELAVDDGGVPLPAVATDAAGHYTFSIQPPLSVGWHPITVAYAGDRLYRPQSTTLGHLVQARTSLTIDGPDTITSDGYPTIIVTLRRANGDPVTGVYLDLDINGVNETDAALTDANGQVRIRRWFTDLNPLDLRATFVANQDRGDVERIYAPASARRLWKGTPLFDLYPRKTYVAGTSATFTASQSITTLEPYVAPWITVSWQASGGTVQNVDHPDDPSSATFTRTLRHNAVITVSSPETYYYNAGTRSFRVGVAPRISGSVVGSTGRDGSIWLVRRAVDPLFTVAVAPNRAGTCAYARVQRYADGAWRGVTRTGCLVLSGESTASWRLTGTFAAGSRYRVRWETPADVNNIAGAGGWQAVRFTR